MKAFCRDPFFVGFPSILIWPSSFHPLPLLCFSSLKPWSRCFFRNIKLVGGSHYSGKKSIFAVELELKLKKPSNMIKQTIDWYATTDTINFSLTLSVLALKWNKQQSSDMAGKNRVRRLDHADLSQISKTMWKLTLLLGCYSLYIPLAN